MYILSIFWVLSCTNIGPGNITWQDIKSNGIHLRARQMLYGHTLHTLYNSLSKPDFEYCLTIWGNTYKTHLNKLQLLQKKVIRLITFSELHAHTASLFDSRNICTLNALHQYYTSILVFDSLWQYTWPYLQWVMCQMAHVKSIQHTVKHGNVWLS